MYAYTSNWIILFPIALSMFVALRLSQASRDSAENSIPVTIIRSAIFIFFLFAFFSLGSRNSFMTIPWVIILIALAFLFWWKGRRLDRSAMMLSVMNAETRDQQLMLAAAFYHANTGFVRRRAKALHRYLTDGHPWAQALELSKISKTVYGQLACRIQSRFGRDRSGYQADAQGPIQIEQDVERNLGRLMIFSWAIFLIPILVFFMSFIVPTFAEKFEEFGLELPPLMKFVIEASDFMASPGLNLLLPLIPLGFLAILLGAVALWLFPQLTRLPGVRWFFRDYYENLGFLALAKSSQFERDIPNACQTTAQLVPVNFIAARYRHVASLLAGGMQTTEAFRKAKLLRKREIKALVFGLESQDPAWGLTQLANFKTERMLRKYSVVIQTGIVVTTILLAIVVGAFAVGVMQCLASMVMDMSTSFK